MIDLIKKNKIVLVVVGVIAAGFVWYGMTGGGSVAGDGAALTSEAAAQSAEERAVLDSLLQMRNIQLTGTIFTDPAFSSLRDFRTDIVAEPVGRRNPFAPLVPVGSSTQPIPRNIGAQDRSSAPEDAAAPAAQP